MQIKTRKIINFRQLFNTSLIYKNTSYSTIRANPFPKVTGLICRLPLFTFSCWSEAVNLRDQLRIWVRNGMELMNWSRLHIATSSIPNLLRTFHGITWSLVKNDRIHFLSSTPNRFTSKNEFYGEIGLGMLTTCYWAVCHVLLRWLAWLSPILIAVGSGRINRS